MIEIPLTLIPIEPGGYHIMIELSVNGLKANTLIDTGASKTIMDLARARHYINDPDIKAFGKQLTGVGTARIDTWVTTVEEIRFAHYAMKNLPLVLADLQTINAGYAVYDLPRIDMVLGGDLLQKLGAVVDYSNKLLKIKI